MTRVQLVCGATTEWRDDYVGVYAWTTIIIKLPVAAGRTAYRIAFVDEPTTSVDEVLLANSAAR